MSRVNMLSEHVRLCTTQVACDGATLFNDRMMCVPCEERLARRARQATKPLKGERCVDYLERRKK